MRLAMHEAADVMQCCTDNHTTQAALSAKLSALSREFNQISEQVSDIPFWRDLFWDTVTVEDWILADAWYRSRCLELPRAGHAMVPGLDMANHSQTHSAYYDESSDGDVVLLPSSGSRVLSGGEITISYGQAKSPAEMLFSYGFIDSDSSVKELTLHIAPLPDDPLGGAKLRVYNGPPTVRLSLTDQGVQWNNPFLYLLVLNEEDGLSFRIAQDTSGERQLVLFWQDEEITDRTDELETLVQSHDLYQVFKLRAVAVLEERVAMQLDRISSGLSYGVTEQPQAANQPRAECMLAAETLRDLETQVLQGVAEALENEVRYFFLSFLSLFVCLRHPCPWDSDGPGSSQMAADGYSRTRPSSQFKPKVLDKC